MINNKLIERSNKMGCACMSISSSDSYKEVSINPNPSNFIIEETEEINGFIIARIKYWDCINFEGSKILVFKNTILKDFYKMFNIDPHFKDVESKLIARFIPTEEGLNMARQFLLNYKRI